MGVVVAVSSALLIGFLTGLLTFKLKLGWCAECGTSLACPADATHEAIRTLERRPTHVATATSRSARKTHAR